jgi:hypothetical protein
VLLPLAHEESLSPTSLISIGAGISVFVVIWEMLTGLEKCAAPFESWRGRAADLDTVIDIGKRRKWAAEAQRQQEGQEIGDEKGIIEEPSAE